MWSWIYSLGLVALGAGCALVGVAAIALAWWLGRQVESYIRGLVERQTSALSETFDRATSEAQAKSAQAMAAALERARADREMAVATVAAETEARVINMRTEDEKRGAVHWGAVKAAEAVTGIAVQLATDIQVQQARLDNLLLRVDWIRAGGNPEANWNDVVRWHNDGRKNLH